MGMMPWIGAAAGQAIDAYNVRSDQNQMMDLREKQDQRQERQMQMGERQDRQNEAIAHIKVAMAALEMTPDEHMPKFVEHFNATVAKQYPEYVMPLSGVRRVKKGEYQVQAHGGEFFRVDTSSGSVEKIPGASYEHDRDRETWNPAQDIPGVGRVQTSSTGKENRVAPPGKEEKSEKPITEAQAWEKKASIAKTRATIGEPSEITMLEVKMGLAKPEDVGKTITPEAKTQWKKVLDDYDKYLDQFIGGGNKDSGGVAALKGEKAGRIYIKELDKTVLWDGQKVVAEKPGRFTGKF